MTAKPDWLTAAQVAALHGCTRAAIYVRAKRLGLGTRFGRTLLFSPKDAKALAPGPAGNPQFGPGYHQRRKTRKDA